MRRSMNGKLRRASRSRASAPSRSWMLAECTLRPAAGRAYRSGCGACGQAPSCQRHSRTGRAKPPFDGTLRSLAVNDRRRRARFSARLLSDLHIERVVDASQRAVPIPQVQVLPDRAARRQVLRKRLPLTARPKHVEDGVQDLADVHRPRSPTALGGRDQRADQRPLSVSQITLVPQATTIRRRAMFWLPHEAPLPTQVPPKESHPIPPTQLLSGTALRTSGSFDREVINGWT